MKYMIPKDNMTLFETYLDKTDQDTLDYIFSISEAEQDQLMLNITKRLYTHITKNITDIDFGTIPKSKGDITKIENYDTMIDCIEVIQKLLVQSKQKTDSVDTISKAIENIKIRKSKFEMGFKLNDELVCLLYSAITSSIVSSVGFLISTCIDFIKSPGDTIELSINRTALKQTHNNLLFDNLNKFNMGCKTGQVDLVLDTCIKKGSKDLLGVLGTYTITQGAFLVAIGLFIIPLLRELIYFFYYTRVQISDYFEIQAELLEANAYTLQDKNEKGIAKKQLNIATSFRKIADKIHVESKQSEDKARKRIKQEELVMKTSPEGELSSASDTPLF